MVRLTHCKGDAEEVPRIGVEKRLPLCVDDFKTVFSIKASLINHSGAMELEAVELALLRLCRNTRLHGHRGAVLVDAKVVGPQPELCGMVLVPWRPSHLPPICGQYILTCRQSPTRQTFLAEGQ